MYILNLLYFNITIHYNILGVIYDEEIPAADPSLNEV